MNYIEKIDEIILILKENDQQIASEKIHFLKNSASTGSELLMSVTFKLKELVDNDNNIKNIIYKEYMQLRNYCNSIGLLIK